MEHIYVLEFDAHVRLRHAYPSEDEAKADFEKLCAIMGDASELHSGTWTPDIEGIWHWLPKTNCIFENVSITPLQIEK